MEAKALLNSGWWGNTSSDNHCNLKGVTCNNAGNVTQINLSYYSSSILYPKCVRLQNLSWSLLPNLEVVVLRGCSIGGFIPSEIGTLSKLTHLDISSNTIHGMIPHTMGNLSQLVTLNLSHNFLSGSLHPTLRSLSQLVTLDLSHNFLTGPLPDTLGSLSQLVTLDLSNNSFAGYLPRILRDLTQLSYFHVSWNLIAGPIPLSIGRLTNLAYMDISENFIEGSIPREIGLLKNLTYMDMSENLIEGSIPQEIGLLKNLTYFKIGHNKIHGPIPSDIKSLKNLIDLDLSYNHLNGEIPCGLAFYQIKTLDLSHNNLSGKVPCFLYSHFIGKYVDFSSNALQKGCLNAKSFVALLKLAFFYRTNRKGKRTLERTIENGDICSIWNYDGKIGYEDIIKATNDFDIRYCIGTGSYGSVYRAQLPNGRVVALKKLHRLETEELAFVKCFKNEVQMLSNIRHRNVVKLYGFCLHNKDTFLVYEYMEKGSLFCILRIDEEASELGWTQRVNTVQAVAHALSYLHHDCTPPIIHRDISSNNILLNSKLEAVVGDFGTARLLYPDSSNQTVVAGTLGYVAPVHIPNHITTHHYSSLIVHKDTYIVQIQLRSHILIMPIKQYGNTSIEKVSSLTVQNREIIGTQFLSDFLKLQIGSLDFMLITKQSLSIFTLAPRHFNFYNLVPKLIKLLNSGHYTKFLL
ncbi:Non-specific serine/threonine protein kinase, partial [Bertholletia excelsa]